MPLSIKARFGLGLLGSYASYSAVIQALTYYEIEKRDREFEITNTEDCCNKYSTLHLLGRFENPFPEYRALTLFEFGLSRLLELFEGSTRGGAPTDPKEIRRLLPIFQPDLDLLWNNSKRSTQLPLLSERLVYTWLGQSCAYLQISGISFLTDPIFEDYIVNKYIGPKRITPSPVQLKDLPVPDYTLVSHNHPDHFEEESIEKLGNSTTWVVPLGLRNFLGRKGIHNVIEMKWWQRVSLPKGTDNHSYEIVCLPAMHWSGRFLYDSNTSLWCSFMILRDGRSLFYHAGDTGFTAGLFQQIQEKYGPTLLAMLPIGQYCPQWHQKSRHINPKEALDIMDQLKAKYAVGVHWGTFILSSENFLEPKTLFEEESLKNGKRAFVPDFGKTMVICLTDNDGKGLNVSKIRDGQSFYVK